MVSWLIALMVPTSFYRQRSKTVLTFLSGSVTLKRVWGLTFGDTAVVPALNPSFHGCFPQKSGRQRWFSLRSCGRKGLPPKGAAGGSLRADRSERPYACRNASGRNGAEGVQREQCLASYFSARIGNVAVLAPQGLRQSSATLVLLLFCPLLMCLCQQTRSLPAVVLRAEAETSRKQSSPQFGVRGLPIAATSYLP